MQLMVDQKVSSIAVIPDLVDEKVTLDAPKPVPMPIGIITKSDIVRAYHNEVGIHEPCEKIMNQCPLQTCSPTVDRDRAARILEHNRTHHIIVLDDKTHNFVGLISSWDLTAECARDDRAWPWIRSEDGKFHNPLPQKKRVSSSLKYDKQSILHHGHEEYTVYMDELDVLNFQ
jgi:CBS domain containing-hemolysin-like protein